MRLNRGEKVGMRTYEELLAAQTELAHFNPNHDPDTGRFIGNMSVAQILTPSSKRQMKKRLGIAAGITAGLLAAYTTKKNINVSRMIQGFGGGNLGFMRASEIVETTLKSTGKVALAATLAVIGSYKVKDIMSKNNKSNNNGNTNGRW